MSQTKAQLLAPVGIFTASGINVSGTLTATSYSGSGANLSGVGVGTTASVNTSGIITAVSFSGDGSNLGGVGFGTEDSAVTTGIVTASKFVGSGIGLTNIGGPIAGLVYSPSIGGTSVSVETNIEIIFSKPIQAGVGTITLRTDAADGTIVESYDISSSDRLTIDTAKLTIDPTDNLSGLTTYFVVIPSGTVKDTFAGISSNTAIDTYSFTTQILNYELWAWGYNNFGGLGQNTATQYSSPVQIPGIQWQYVTADYYTTHAIKTDNTLWGWGRNYYGNIGVSNLTQYSSPVQLPGTQWVDVAGGNFFAASTKSDGTLWMWGANTVGQLGQNNTTNYSSPRQVPGTEWSYIGSTVYQANFGAIKTDGTLWMWGLNSVGQLGQNNTTNYSSPRQIPGTQWSVYTSGGSSTVSIKNDGTLWTWGDNQYGMLGQGDTTVYSSPRQVPGTQWSKVATLNGVSTIASKSDGTLWSWGLNNIGQLGISAVTHRSSPVQIPGTEWSTSSLGFGPGYRSVRVLKTDGTLWSWGFNYVGNLGQNNKTQYSSPVQIPGTQWNSLGKATVYSAHAIKQIT